MPYWLAKSFLDYNRVKVNSLWLVSSSLDVVYILQTCFKLKGIMIWMAGRNFLWNSPKSQCLNILSDMIQHFSTKQTNLQYFLLFSGCMWSGSPTNTLFPVLKYTIALSRVDRTCLTNFETRCRSTQGHTVADWHSHCKLLCYFCTFNLGLILYSRSTPKDWFSFFCTTCFNQSFYNMFTSV